MATTRVRSASQRRTASIATTSTPPSPNELQNRSKRPASTMTDFLGETDGLKNNYTASEIVSVADHEEQLLIGPWRIGTSIYQGYWGSISLAEHSVTGQRVAAKSVRTVHSTPTSRNAPDESFEEEREQARECLEREGLLLKLIDHPNIVKLHDIRQTVDTLYLFLEYAERGNLFDYITMKTRLDPNEALRIFRQLTSGLAHLHRLGICHRDLKAENLLLDEDGNLKIADFGFSTMVRDDELLTRSCGSRHYASPEIYSGNPHRGFPSDIWACGVILFALLNGRLPFESSDLATLVRDIEAGIFTMPGELAPDAADLIQRILTVDPAKRITMEGILAHPWVTRRSVPVITNVDSDILAHLALLHDGLSAEDLEAALTSKGNMPQKTMYLRLVDMYISKEQLNSSSRRDTKLDRVRKASPRLPSSATRKPIRDSPVHSPLKAPIGATIIPVRKSSAVRPPLLAIATPPWHNAQPQTLGTRKRVAAGQKQQDDSQPKATPREASQTSASDRPSDESNSRAAKRVRFAQCVSDENRSRAAKRVRFAQCVRFAQGA